MIRIEVNGETIELPGKTTAAQLLELKNIVAENSVLAVNGNIIAPEDYGKTVFRNGDKIDLMCFTGGG